MSAPAVSAAGARGIGTLRVALARFANRGPRASAWRVRAPLIAALSVVLLAGIVVLVAYHGFYDARFRALEATRAELAARRDDARAAAERIKATEMRLRTVQKDLESFNKDVLGTRKERLAALIEDVYALTQKAGLVPGQISYALGEATGVDRLALTFGVQGRYADVKRLLFSFENNPRFLLLETVGVATDDREPDVLRLNLVVAHYFRPETSGARRGTRAPAARPSPARPVPTPSKPPPNAGVPE
jgi:Tfp pilus assembly protein PilO